MCRSRKSGRVKNPASTTLFEIGVHNYILDFHLLARTVSYSTVTLFAKFLG
jgi:hypothetical protein